MKKNLNKRKLITLLFALCLCLLQACRKDVLVSNSKGIQQGISIEEAKNYFNEHIRSTAAPKKLMSTSGIGNPTNEQLLDNMLAAKQPIWESAYQQLLSSGASSVKIPLDLGPVFMITDEAKKEMIPFGALNYLFMFKDSLQHIHSQWVTLLPDRDWLYGNRSQYTGDIQVKTWEGTLLRQFHYDKQRPLSGSHTSASGKISAIKKTSNDLPGSEIPLLQIICISFANSSKCTCIDKSNCDMCWQCTSNVCRPSPAAIPIPENNGPDVGGTGSNGGGGSAIGGGGGYSPPDYAPTGCVSDPSYKMPSYPAPSGYDWAAPCNGPGIIPIPTGPIVSSTIIENVVNLMGITDPKKQNFLYNNIPVYEVLYNFLIGNQNIDENKEFVSWAVDYIIENPGINIELFRNQFMPVTEIIADPDESSWTDLDNETFDDPDQTVYQQYQDNQPWPTVKSIIEYEKFVPNRYIPNTIPPKIENCLVLAKEQLGKKGYTVSGYYVGSPQIYQAYTEEDGVDLAKTKEGITYMIDALSKGIPILVGVDVKPGAPLANKDRTTNHFIVIVGMGSDNNGKYFQFMDSSTNWPTLGSSSKNKLYYNQSTGKITGKTMSQYANLTGHHDYIVTQIRKSIKK